MNNGILTRLIAARILKNLKTSFITYDDAFNKNILKYKLKKSDINLVQNIVLSTLRYCKIADQILASLTVKINKKDISYFLIISGITQICYLNFKSYAVVNSTCEAYKIMGDKKILNFINGVLRNISKKKELFQKSNWDKPKYPSWFKRNIKYLPSKKRKNLYKSLLVKPSLHLNFKTNKDIDNIKKRYIKTSCKSIAIKDNINIVDLEGYKSGRWWIQDYAATIPVKLMGDIYKKKVLDMCSAPGGKTFQLINMGADVTSNDFSKKRLETMKENAKRLNYDIKILELNFLKINEKNKYEIILLDAPCTAIGTVKRNPEILFRDNGPNIKYLIKQQQEMLNKASRLLILNGLLLYTVCSIFEDEGRKQIEKFIIKNKNFIVDKIKKNEINLSAKIITKEGFIQTFPYNLNQLGGVDGFFIARLKKIK